MTYIDEKNIQRTYYEVLEIPITATESEIKFAYREMLLKNHPDKVGNEKSKDIEITAIKEAYYTLINTVDRMKYDESLKRTIQRQGFNINGGGLDTYSLNDFVIEEAEEDIQWFKDCPRCQFPKGVRLTEVNLIENGTEDGNGGYDIIVQCESCSLWIKVKYYEDKDSGNE